MSFVRRTNFSHQLKLEYRLVYLNLIVVNIAWKQITSFSFSTYFNFRFRWMTKKKPLFIFFYVEWKSVCHSNQSQQSTALKKKQYHKQDYFAIDQRRVLFVTSSMFRWRSWCIIKLWHYNESKTINEIEISPISPRQIAYAITGRQWTRRVESTRFPQHSWR